MATVIGQDLDEDAEGVFRIARRAAKDRVISTVDPDARHGHKTAAHGFDGYKGHVGIDPDSEIITATTLTPGNAGDASAATDLVTDLAGDHITEARSKDTAGSEQSAQPDTEQADDKPGDTEPGDDEPGQGLPGPHGTSRSNATTRTRLVGGRLCSGRGGEQHAFSPANRSPGHGALRDQQHRGGVEP